MRERGEERDRERKEGRERERERWRNREKEAIATSLTVTNGWRFQSVNGITTG